MAPRRPKMAHEASKCPLEIPKRPPRRLRVAFGGRQRIPTGFKLLLVLHIHQFLVPLMFPLTYYRSNLRSSRPSNIQGTKLQGASADVAKRKQFPEYFPGTLQDIAWDYRKCPEKIQEMSEEFPWKIPIKFPRTFPEMFMKSPRKFSMIT